MNVTARFLNFLARMGQFDEEWARLHRVLNGMYGDEQRISTQCALSRMIEEMIDRQTKDLDPKQHAAREKVILKLMEYHSEMQRVDT